MQVAGTFPADGPAGVVFVKLGGSLITDKSRPETVREAVLERLAGELAAAAAERPGGLIVGHGSGSFGHVAAARWGVHRGQRHPGAGDEALAGVARTQELAARLHRRVVGELLAAGARPFSFVPSSALVLAGGRPAGAAAEPLVRALGLGLLPVTHGDVMLDREVGYGICSTELLFERLVGELAGAGIAVAGCLWLGETPGIWDAAGRPLPRIDPGAAGTALAAAGESAGTDVTGGMRLRLESALRLAARGVESWILDGREERVVARGIAALAGGKPPVGTRVG